MAYSQLHAFDDFAVSASCTFLHNCLAELSQVAEFCFVVSSFAMSTATPVSTTSSEGLQTCLRLEDSAAHTCIRGISAMQCIAGGDVTHAMCISHACNGLAGGALS